MPIYIHMYIPHHDSPTGKSAKSVTIADPAKMCVSFRVTVAGSNLCFDSFPNTSTSVKMTAIMASNPRMFAFCMSAFWVSAETAPPPLNAIALRWRSTCGIKRHAPIHAAGDRDVCKIEQAVHAGTCSAGAVCAHITRNVASTSSFFKQLEGMSMLRQKVKRKNEICSTKLLSQYCLMRW